MRLTCRMLPMAVLSITMVTSGSAETAMTSFRNTTQLPPMRQGAHAPMLLMWHRSAPSDSATASSHRETLTSVETPTVSQMEDFTSSRAFRVAGAKAFAEAGITHKDVDHLMIYDAFAHLPIYGLGFVPRGEAGRFIAERNTAPAANCRSTPMAAVFRTCIPACTACTRCK